MKIGFLKWLMIRIVMLFLSFRNDRRRVIIIPVLKKKDLRDFYEFIGGVVYPGSYSE